MTLLPHIKKFLVEVLGDELNRKLCVQFGGLDGRMAHHDLQNLFWNTFSQADGARKGVSCDMGGKGKGAVQSQSQSFEELIVLLVGSDVELIIVPFQNLFCVGQEWE